MVQTRQAVQEAQAQALSENTQKNMPDGQNINSNKRKLNGYMLWSLEERKNISKHEVFSGRDIFRILGSRWRNLTEDEKLKWNNLAKQGSSQPTEIKVEKKQKKPARQVKEEKDNTKNKKGKNKKF